MRTEEQAIRAVEQYGNTVRRICFLNLKNREDTEDIFQNIFLKFLMYKGEFECAEHEKAWFIRVTVNACKDLLKSFYRKNKLSLEAAAEVADQADPQDKDLLLAVLALPEQYKTAIYLFYFEDYSAEEISKCMGKKLNTIYSLLSRGRLMLKEKLGGELDAQ